MNYTPVFKEYTVAVSDGTRLYTRAIFPADYGEGKRYPVVFHRTPYEPPVSRSPFDPAYLKPPFTDFLERGYVIVNQHCRGTGSSQGIFRNLMDEERTDSLETLDWLRTQDFYGGEIYLYGASYKAYIHSTYVGLNPPDVKGAVLAVMPANQYYICYERNTPKHDLYTLWFARYFMRNHVDTKEKFALASKNLMTRPLSALGERVYGKPIHELTDVFYSNSPDRELWQNSGGFSYATHAPETIKIPLLLVGGFYDIHYRGTVDYWERLNGEARSRSAMFIGPWWHYMETAPQHAHLLPGSEHPPVEAEWLDHIRLGTPLTHVTLGKTTYYRAGDGWLQSDYLGSNANSQLTLHPAYGSALDTKPAYGSLSYRFDPEHPARFPGGANVFQQGNGGLREQPDPGFRQDVLSFTSAPVTEPIALDGKIHARLEVSSDCPDTAFFVRASVVRDKTAWFLRDTIVSVSDLIDGYVPGQRVVLDFDLDQIAWTLAPGDRLRVDVSSSNFPTYNVHSNTADYWCDADHTAIAHNTLYFSHTKFSFDIEK